jgi:hypothetical protein
VSAASRKKSAADATAEEAHAVVTADGNTRGRARVVLSGQGDNDGGPLRAATAKTVITPISYATTSCPDGYESDADHFSCFCRRAGATPDEPTKNAPLPPINCTIEWPKAEGARCVWTCRDGYIRGNMKF